MKWSETQYVVQTCSKGTVCPLLSRLTAQRSIEDAEEVERERRRRTRKASRWTNGGSLPGEPSLENETQAEESV